MYNFVKKIPVFALVLLVSSCGGKIHVDSIDKSYTTKTVRVDAKIPQISGLSSESFAEGVNSDYRESITVLMDEFKEKAEKTGDKSTFTATTTEHYNKDGFLSVVTQIDCDVPGGHNNSYRITKNIDTNQCVEVPLSELFEGEEYIDMINSRLETELKENGEKYAGLWEKPRLLDDQDYYVSGNNLVVYYLPYKLSYYERGFVEFPLKLSDMSGYLKEEYRYLAEKQQ